jgi:phospholipase D1/2
MSDAGLYHDPWPEPVPPDFADVTIGIARTEPAYTNRKPVREVEQLFMDCIDAAERSIYIENQFLTAPRIAERLAGRLRACPRLEVLIVCPERHDSWLEAHIMRVGRTGFAKILREAGGGRVLLMYPQIESDDCKKNTMVHAKVMIGHGRVSFHRSELTLYIEQGHELADLTTSTR